MKRIFIAASLFALLSGMGSCKSSSSFENDVTKMGNYQCRVQKLLAKDQNDEKVKKEMAELKTEMDDYAMKMMTKY